MRCWGRCIHSSRRRRLVVTISWGGAPSAPGRCWLARWPAGSSSRIRWCWGRWSRCWGRTRRTSSCTSRRSSASGPGRPPSRYIATSGALTFSVSARVGCRGVDHLSARRLHRAERCDADHPAFAARPERGDRRRAPHLPGGDAERLGCVAHVAHDPRRWCQPQRACATRAEHGRRAGVIASGVEPVPVVSTCGIAHDAARPSETCRLQDRCVCAGVCRRRARPRCAAARDG